MSMTEDQLRAIEARADAATPGPWIVSNWGYEDDPIQTIEAPPSANPDGISEHFPDLGYSVISDAENAALEVDLQFIAEARADIPALVAEVRRLQREIDRMNGESEGANGN